MAKQMVNPVERHVEKLVLGAAALVLVYAAVAYVFTSPNKMELGGEVVTPRTVDAAVARRADDIVTRLQNADAAVEIPEPLYEAFAGSIAPLKPEPLPGIAPFQPDVPIIDPPITVVGRAKLVKVLVPDKPRVTSGRSTLSRSGTGPPYTPGNWVTVSSVLDYRKQVDLQKQAYGATQDVVTLLPAEIQRRKAQPDGSWSDSDWQDVKAWPAAPPVPIPNLSLVDGREGKVLSADDQRRRENFEKAVAEPQRQRDAIRPLMVEIVNGTKWSFPILTSYMDVRKQDHYFIAASPVAEMGDLYGLGPAAAAPQPTRELTPEQLIDQALKEAEALVESARKNRSVADTIRANNKAVDVIGSTAASPAQKSRAENLRRQAAQAESDIKRELMTGGTAPSSGPAETTVQRAPEPIQQMWVHDAAEGSLETDATYQYRMRFCIYNQFAGAPEKFDTPEDATQLVLVSDWSEPTDPIFFEPVSLYFVTYDDKTNQEIGVEFFRWYYGVWLKSRRQKVGIGDMLFIEHRVPAPSLDNPEVADEPEVEFSADGMLVDVDFSRKSQERKAGKGDSGVTFGPIREDTAAVFVDSEGRLVERFVSLDRDDPAKREATARVWTPRRR